MIEHQISFFPPEPPFKTVASCSPSLLPCCHPQGRRRCRWLLGAAARARGLLQDPALASLPAPRAPALLPAALPGTPKQLPGSRPPLQSPIQLLPAYTDPGSLSQSRQECCLEGMVSLRRLHASAHGQTGQPGRSRHRTQRHRWTSILWTATCKIAAEVVSGAFWEQRSITVSAMKTLHCSRM